MIFHQIIGIGITYFLLGEVAKMVISQALDYAGSEVFNGFSTLICFINYGCVYKFLLRNSELIIQK